MMQIQHSSDRLANLQNPKATNPVYRWISSIKGMSEQIRRVFKKYDVPAYFKPVNTLRQLLPRPKDEMLKGRVVGPVYHIPCDLCDASKIAETERSLKARFMEQRRHGWS